jgi:site-specific recombinase XerD
VDRVVGGLAVAGRKASTRREYVQIFKAFHRFLQVRKAGEIEAAFGIRVVCPVDEFNASRHVGDDSPQTLAPPTPERVAEFFEFLKARMATARKYAPAARDYAMFRTLYHAGLRSEEASMLDVPDVHSSGARSGSCICVSGRPLTRPGRGRGGCRCSTAWTWCCAGSWTTCVAGSRTRRCCSPTSPADGCIAGRSAIGCAG